MNKRNLQNEKLDKIGQNLLKTAGMRSDSIEKIVASPQLFSSVKAKIEAEKFRRKTKYSFGSWAAFAVWNWRKAGIVIGVLIVLLIGIGSLIVFTKRESSSLMAQQSVKSSPSLQVLSLKTPDLPKVFENTSKFIKTGNAPVKKQRLIQRIVFKKEKIELNKSLQKSYIAKRQPQPKIKDDDKFYPLILSGIPSEIKGDFKIIRLDMTRSSLFALGVNVSPENEYGTIKADLLVGSDGIPQAIRFVRPK